MKSLHINGVEWYTDPAAAEKGEPGLWNTYIASLGAVLSSLGEVYDPAWLMGASGWAFRIIAHKELCPSAMSVFDWDDLLPRSVAQLGRTCTHISCFFDSKHKAQRQQEAHEAICEALEKGIPVISWDMSIPEWELLVGYDDDTQAYDFVSCTGERGTLAREELGNRETGIPLLSVTIIGQSNNRSRDESVRRSLQMAVDHAYEREWLERPEYLSGLPAYGQWANAIEPDYTGSPNWEWSAYYAAHWVGARCYARDYLNSLVDEYPSLVTAAETYSRLAKELIPVWQAFSVDACPSEEARIALTGRLRRAGEIERKGIRQLESFLYGIKP